MEKFKDMVDVAEKELQEEDLEGKKEYLKERIREIQEARKTLKQLENQYSELLEKGIDEVDDGVDY